MKIFDSPRSIQCSSLVGLVLAILGSLSVRPAEATTLQRTSLEDLTKRHSTVLVGKVVESFSYWNEEATAILTDVVVEHEALLKGLPGRQKRTTLTLLGGEVDGMRQVIVGGASLQRGRSYVLFIDALELPGAPEAKTIPSHSQGVFEITLGADGELRAVNQASTLHLAADSKGLKTAVGGVEGLEFDQMLRRVEDIKNMQADKARHTQEVK